MVAAGPGARKNACGAGLSRLAGPPWPGSGRGCDLPANHFLAAAVLIVTVEGAPGTDPAPADGEESLQSVLGFPALGGFPARELASLSFHWTSFLVSRSCSGGENPACFDPSDPLQGGRCSFRTPQLCESVREFAIPEVFHRLGIERAKLRDRRGHTRVRLKGHYELELEDLPLEGDGRVTVVLAHFAESLELGDFRPHRAGLKWKGRHGAVRKILLRSDGSFWIELRNVPSELVGGDTLPFLLQVGETTGGAFLYLE